MNNIDTIAIGTVGLELTKMARKLVAALDLAEQDSVKLLLNESIVDTLAICELIKRMVTDPDYPSHLKDWASALSF